MTKKGERKRSEIIQQLKVFLLENGLRATTLQNLADAAGVSDRMIIHHFKTKDAVLEIVLERISSDLVNILDAQKTAPMSFPILIKMLSKSINSPVIRPYLRLWLSLVGASASHGEPYLLISRRMLDGFHDWLYAALSTQNLKLRRSQAAAALALIEGFVLLDSLDQGARIKLAIDALS